jgi:hypothetical protein
MVHGYNIDTMFYKVLDYLEDEGEGKYDTYHHCLIIVRTTEGDSFGAMITAAPISQWKKTAFVGNFESFVFTAHVDDEVQIYK